MFFTLHIHMHHASKFSAVQAYSYKVSTECSFMDVDLAYLQDIPDTILYFHACQVVMSIQNV